MLPENYCSRNAEQTMAASTMKILIAHHRWWFPTALSGADVANHEFARNLKQSGFEIKVHGIVSPKISERTRQRSYVTDGIEVSLVQSDFIKNLSKVIKAYKPDVMLTSCPEPSCGSDDIIRMMDLCDRHGLPVVLYIHELGQVMPLFEKVKNRLAKVLTNSHFMAGKIFESWNIKADVVYPVPAFGTFKMKQSKGPFITFFSPRLQKGSDIADFLVKNSFPDRSFLYVEGFMDPEAHGISLFRTGNLVRARQSPNVAAIYMMTHTLIIPSQWAESFGRVALEAMYNQTPVIASNTGGLSESVGRGGILIDDFSNVKEWEKAIIRLDDPLYRKAIIENGNRHVKKFSIKKETDKFIKILQSI
jgi:hypothetical protein